MRRKQREIKRGENIVKFNKRRKSIFRGERVSHNVKNQKDWIVTLNIKFKKEIQVYNRGTLTLSYSLTVFPDLGVFKPCFL